MRIRDWRSDVCSSDLRTPNNSRFSVGSVLADEDLKLIAAARPYWGLGMTETLGPYSYGDVHRAPGRPLCAPKDHWAEGLEVDRKSVGQGKSVSERVNLGAHRRLNKKK